MRKDKRKRKPRVRKQVMTYTISEVLPDYIKQILRRF